MRVSRDLYQPLYAAPTDLEQRGAPDPAETPETPETPEVPAEQAVSLTPTQIRAEMRAAMAEEIDARTKVAADAQQRQPSADWDPERNAIRAIGLRDQMLDEALEVLGDDVTPKMLKEIRADLGQFSTAADIQAAMSHGIHKTIADAHYARAVRSGDVVPARLKEQMAKAAGSAAPKLEAPRREPTGGGAPANGNFDRYLKDINEGLPPSAQLTKSQALKAWEAGDNRRYA